MSSAFCGSSVNSNEVHSILFSKSYWTPSSSLSFLKKNNYIPIKAMHETKNFYRYRLHPPSFYSRFFTEVDDKQHLQYVIGIR